MPQITITIPESLDATLRDVAERESMTISQLAALCLQIGIPSYIEGLNKYCVYKKLMDQFATKPAASQTE